MPCFKEACINERARGTNSGLGTTFAIHPQGQVVDCWLQSSLSESSVTRYLHAAVPTKALVPGVHACANHRPGLVLSP